MADAATRAASGYQALDPCVHCGFCLPACPTYLATGDEADSPRGRILLMRALERGEIAATDPALAEHLDACLGCRGCEPVCPSGVGYGRGLEAARADLVRARGLSGKARALLAVFSRRWLWRPIFTAARWLRATGAPAQLSGGGAIGFQMGMLAATRPRQTRGAPASRRTDSHRGTVAIFRGCVMDTLLGQVHDAVRRTLVVNGYQVIEVPDQFCCGALHEHAGDREGARALAARNLAALSGTADYIVVDSAGCGALLKDYGHLLGSDEAEQLAARVRDVTELLAAAGPVAGAPLDLDVAYDAPCHLQHAQGVHDQVLAVFGAIPGLRLRLLPGYDRCCGSAGIYSLLQPAMSRRVLDDKIESIRAAVPQPQVVATGNPGCLMQIGAGLRAAGLPITVAHPVELLDRSYAAAGFYDR
ncbi:MAG TPA: heterodisulfide reductase-related iron-sulfur binding cluster [Gemmatimonadales bacterium]|nr:heterodisulfide reductase-related iron-sulfur binding cluster [Gemmatimonadales bacterium]